MQYTFLYFPLALCVDKLMKLHFTDDFTRLCHLITVVMYRRIRSYRRHFISKNLIKRNRNPNKMIETLKSYWIWSVGLSSIKWSAQATHSFRLQHHFWIMASPIDIVQIISLITFKSSKKKQQQPNSTECGCWTIYL